jgi:hypothetical protein
MPAASASNAADALPPSPSPSRLCCCFSLQGESALAGRCLQLSISSAQQENWQACLGGLRLGQLLGCRPAGEQLEALNAVKASALQDNGTNALLAAEQVDKMLGMAAA